MSKPRGSVRVGSSCVIADGAAALVMVSADRASKLGLRVRHLSLIQQNLQSLFMRCEAQDQLTTLLSTVEGAADLVPMFADKAPELSSEL